MEGLFYRRKVNIRLKDPIFESSTPMCHVAELYDILVNSQQGHPYLLVYTDGDNDHQLPYNRKNKHPSKISTPVTLEQQL
jgi:hypothetical protein